MKEVWKEIVDYEEYYSISNFGRVRSKDRIVSRGKDRTYLKEGRVLSLLNNKGYKLVFLYKGYNRKQALIHQLVAIHFIDNINNRNEINHLDCNPNNNRVDNLEWCTHKENMVHASKNNLLPCGENNGNSLLNKKVVLEIFKSKDSVQLLAKRYNISSSSIYKIKQKKIWKHILN